MSRIESVLDWPQAAVPALRSCGHFPMAERNAGLVYLSPRTVALHLHHYAGIMWLGRRRIRLQPGDLTLTPAGLPSRYDLPRAGSHWCGHFDAAAARGATVALPCHWRPGAHGRWLSERLEEVTALYRRGEEGGGDLARQAAGVMLQGLLLWLAVTVAGGSGAKPRLSRVDAELEQVRHFLDEHFREPMALPELARRFGVSQNYLARRFRLRHGMTVQRYLLSRRVEFARHLLAVTRLPLKAVAIEAGLGNPQYFHRQFVRAVGHSPSRERALAVAMAQA